MYVQLLLSWDLALENAWTAMDQTNNVQLNIQFLQSKL